MQSLVLASKNSPALQTRTVVVVADVVVREVIVVDVADVAVTVVSVAVVALVLVTLVMVVIVVRVMVVVGALVVSLLHLALAEPDGHELGMQESVDHASLMVIEIFPSYLAFVSALASVNLSIFQFW